MFNLETLRRGHREIERPCVKSDVVSNRFQKWSLFSVVRARTALVLGSTRWALCLSHIHTQAPRVYKSLMVLKRAVVKWLAVEGCIRGMIPLGAGKSTLVQRLQHREDVIVVRGVKESCRDSMKSRPPLLEATEQSSLSRKW